MVILKNDDVAPLTLRGKKNSLHIYVHPLLESVVDSDIIPLDFTNVTTAKDSLMKNYKQKVDFLDL